MYVCVCNAVTDREIRARRRSSARTDEDLSATLASPPAAAVRD